MFIKMPSALDVSWTTYLDVFDLRLWLVLVLTIVIGSSAMFGMYRLERRFGLRQDGSGVFSWRDSLLHFFGALCQQGMARPTPTRQSSAARCSDISH